MKSLKDPTYVDIFKVLNILQVRISNKFECKIFDTCIKVTGHYECKTKNLVIHDSL